MPEAQKWLDQTYSLENRVDVTELDISKKGLWGSLFLVGFSNLTKLICDRNQITELDLSSCSKLVKINCRNNKLTNLKITNLPYLEKFSCFNNQLAELNWQAFNPEKLTSLSLSNNCFSQQDLSCFSHFINLEGLWIGTDKKHRIDGRIYNRFHGSLEPLKNFTKLKELQIEVTDIEDGLEYLPQSLEKIICWNSHYCEGFQVKKLEDILVPYKQDQKYYNFSKWREDRKKEWEEKGFGNQEIGQWITIGLNINEWDFADYLKQKGSNFLSLSIVDIERLRKEYYNAQEWLDFNYPLEMRKVIARLDISNKHLHGSLSLENLNNLEELNCSYNQLTNLSINNHPSLTKVCCFDNKMTKLEINSCSKLDELICHENQITGKNFNINGCPQLRRNSLVWTASVQEWLDWVYPIEERREITRLDISKFNKKLEGSLKIVGFTNLQEIDCCHNNLASLDINDCPKLTRIDCSWNQLANLVVTGCEWLTEIICHSNKLESLNLIDCRKLEKINCYRNKLSNLDLTNYPNLRELYCSSNRLSDLDLSKCPNLIVLNCSRNRLTNLQLTNYPQLKVIDWKTSSSDFQLSTEIINQIKDFKHSCDGILNNLTSKQELLINKLIPNKELKERYLNYGLCQKCQQPNTGSIWCQHCNSLRFQEDFRQWTSGNITLDKFIQKFQLEAINNKGILEWIPYEQFENIKHIANGGFGTVSKAKWIKGPIRSWNIENNRWERISFSSKPENVALKSLHNSQNMTADFLQEVTYHKRFNFMNSWVVECHGVSQDPKTKDYFIVMDYIEGGNIRRYLNNNQLSFRYKLQQLYLVATGLKSIHEQGLVHRDFHSGNVLNNGTYSYISDLGLCRPVDKIDKGIYGVLPYVAPEVLRGKEYTKAADVYSWGIVVAEVLTGLFPYHNIAHDEFLTIKVCQGLRPNLNLVKIPQLLKDLISRCWDADPEKRPTASELSNILTVWYDEVKYEEGSEFAQQYKEIKEIETLNQASSLSTNNLTHKIHPSAVYTSRLLNFENLPEPQNSKKINEEFYSQSQIFDFTEEEETSQEEVTVKIQIPPK